MTFLLRTGSKDSDILQGRFLSILESGGAGRSTRFQALGRRSCLEAYGPAFIHWTVKLVPSAEIADGSDLTTAELDWLTMVISWIAAP